MYVIGICESHDAAVCLLEDGTIRAAVALERILRVKRAVVKESVRVAATHKAIEYCLGVAGIGWDAVDYVAGVSPDASSQDFNEVLMRRLTGVPQTDKVIVMPHPAHHLAHAYSAFGASGYPSAAALIIDCYGSVIGSTRECESAYQFAGAAALPERIFKHIKPIRFLAHHDDAGLWRIPDQLHGVGEMYRTVTLLLGFYQQETSYDEAGKTMGLAPYGKPLSKEPVFLRHGPAGTIDSSNALPWLESRGLVVRSSKGKSYLSARSSGTPLSQFHKDLAAQIQWELEEACLHLARHLHDRTGEDRLVLAGGVFLNAVANHRLLTETKFKEVYPFPAATDDGTAIGAAYYAYHEACRRSGKTPQRARMRNASLGATYGAEPVAAALQRFGLPHEVLPSPRHAAVRTGELLAAGKIVGWFQGGAEFGPRALGSRSILADPRIRDIKDVLNFKVKFREAFRPFAPAVVAERAGDYFEIPPGTTSPYMLLIFPVREGYRDAMPGITHVDGTARVQTVTREDDPLFYEVIEAYGNVTGMPVILNTSFNLRGMPIVETPEDALSCFMLTEMDALVIDRYVVTAPDFAAMKPVRADIEIMLKASWPSAAPQYTTDRVRITAPGGASEVAKPIEHQLLEAMDGNRTVAEIAAAAGIDDAAAVPRVLEMCRRQWCRWSGLPADMMARSPLLAHGGEPT